MIWTNKIKGEETESSLVQSFPHDSKIASTFWLYSLENVNDTYSSSEFEISWDERNDFKFPEFMKKESI